MALIVERAVGVVGMEHERAPVRRIDGTRVVGAGRGGEDTLPARRQIDGDDVALVHHSRFGREIGVDRDFAAIRRDVVVARRGLPRRQRDAGASEHVAALARGDVADEHVRVAAVGQPMVPEAVLGALADMRLDLRVLAFLAALRLQRIGREIGPHPRDEGDALRIRKPLRRGTSGGDLREPRRLAAVRRDEIDLRLVVVLALRGERDEAAVRRPLRIAVLVAGGEPPRAKPRVGAAQPGREEPELGAAFVGLHVEGRHGAARLRAVGRQASACRCA